jgi:hypothetical protein
MASISTIGTIGSGSFGRCGKNRHALVKNRGDRGNGPLHCLDTICGAIPVLLYLLFSGYQARQRTFVHTAVIDKFSSAEDFAVFL